MTQRVANQYDVLKCLALVAMTFDHISFFLLPQEEWMRIVGRVAAPVFLLLVGYNGSYRFRMVLLSFAALGSVLDILLAQIWWPQNILWTILFVRLFLDYVVPRVSHHAAALACIIAVPFTLPYLDFGSLGFLFALLGYRLRQGRDWASAFWMVCGFVVYYLYAVEYIVPRLEQSGHIALAMTLAATGMVLWHARYRAPVMVASRSIVWAASGALYYYVGHKIVLEVIRLL